MSNLNDTPSAGRLTERDLSKPGMGRLPSGRTVYDTGKVKIGVRAGEPASQRTMRGMSRDEERLQAALVQFGAADGNAMHPSQWVTFTSAINRGIAANRSRYDGAFESLRLAPLRRPNVIPTSPAWWRRTVDSARLYLALMLAQAKGLLR